MALGTRKPRQNTLWVASEKIAAGPGHRFYQKLNELLGAADFDRRVERLCEPYYEPKGTPGRPSLPPGVYFRMLLVGYFEGIDSERAIAWRCADSLSLRSFLGYGLTERSPDHSTLSRTRQRLPESVYDEVFRLILGIVKTKGLFKGRVVGVDATYLHADASMKSIVRRDTEETYSEYLRRLMGEESGGEVDAEELKRRDKERPKRVSNKEWKSATDEDARVMRLRDGRTRFTYKAENAVDLETGVIVSAEVYPGDAADSHTLMNTLERAEDHVEAAELHRELDEEAEVEVERFFQDEPVEVVADKGYHKAELLRDLKAKGYRSYLPERRQDGQRRWADKGGSETAQAFHQNRARCQRKKGKRHQRRRSEYLERAFAHLCETGGLRRARIRGFTNVEKRYRVHTAAANLGLVMRHLFGLGTPRGWADWFANLSERFSPASCWFESFVELLEAILTRQFGPISESLFREAKGSFVRSLLWSEA